MTASLSRPGSIPLGYLAMFLSLLTAVGLWLVFSGFVVPATRIEYAKTWLPTPCQLVSASVAEKREFDGATYRVDVRFRYRHQGHPYESDQYELSPTWNGNRRAVTAAVERLRAAPDLTCYVDPAEPSRAVLQRGWTNEVLVGAMGLLVAILGPIGYLLVLRARRRQSDASRE